MKTKLLFILALLGSIAFESSAYTILISGGGKDHKYYRVYATARRCECTGVGHNSCLIELSTAGTLRTIWHPVNDVIEFVRVQVDNGNPRGSINYKDDLPVQWNTTEDGALEINIDETGIQGAEN